MASDAVIVDDIHIAGDVSAGGLAVPADASIEDKHIAASAAIERYKMAQDATAPFSVPLLSFRVWNNLGSLLPSTPASDDLGIVGGAFATAAPVISSGDLKAAGATTRYARAIYQIPPEYDAFATVQIVCHAGMNTTAADNSATLDVECYRSDRDGSMSADLATTAAQSINSLTFADKTFAVTSTVMRGGDIVDLRLTVAVNDAATGTAVIAMVGAVELQCDIRA